MMAGLLVLTLVGCVVQRGVAPDVYTAAPDSLALDWYFGPDVLITDHLEIPVPFGWRATQPTSGGIFIAKLVHEGTGVSVEVWGFENNGAVPQARPRAGGQSYFSDPFGAHRDAPALFPAVHQSWASTDHYGELVQGWYGTVGDTEVHVEAIYPLGTAVQGRALVEEILVRLNPATSH